LIRLTDDLTTCHALRREVFIVEQGIDEKEEWDDLDGEAEHLLAYDGETPVGTARLFLKGDTGKIGRICVLKSRRGTGFGADLVNFAVARFRAQGAAKVFLSAQCYAIPFYERCGFAAEGPEYDDAGIPHRDMYLHF
jgi:ElaA protein